MDEMKPCPFCGGRPEKWFWLDEGEWAYTSISCSKCLAKIETRKEVHFFSKENPGKTFFKCEEEAIIKWNNRQK